MPNFSVYDPRQAAMNQLSMLAQKRQQFTDEQYAKAEAERLAKIREMEEQQNEQSRGWLGGAMSMGGMGAMSGNPYVAAGAAALGAAAGIAGSYQNRQSQNKGEGRWASLGKALAHPMGDKFDVASDVMPLMGGAAMMGSLAKQPGPITAAPGASKYGTPTGGISPTDELLFQDPSLAGSSGGYGRVGSAYGAPAVPAYAPANRGYGPYR